MLVYAMGKLLNVLNDGNNNVSIVWKTVIAMLDSSLLHKWPFIDIHYIVVCIFDIMHNI